MKTHATLTMDGPRQLLRAFRRRLREALKDEAPEVRLTEQQQEGQVQFKLAAPAGIPFPPLVAVSTEYPECIARVRWTQDGAQGETTIQNGQVKQASRDVAAASGQPQLLRLRLQDGVAAGLTIPTKLALGLVIDLTPEGIAGFCATSDAETYFKIRGDASDAALLTIRGEAMEWDESWLHRASVPQPLSPVQSLSSTERRTLDALAAQFRAEWLWYAHAPIEDTAIERQRYAETGRPIHAINLKSRRFAELTDLTTSNLSTASLPDSTGPLFSTLASSQDWIATLLARTWAHPEAST